MQDTGTKSVKIAKPDYLLLAEKSKATGRQIKWLLSRAIQRVYGKGKQ